MVSRRVGQALVRTENDQRWTVTSVEYPQGVVRLERRARLTQVIIGDRTGLVPASPGAESFAAAACTLDGELLVAVRSAPPAIVVGPQSCRTRPSEGASLDSEFALPGGRLILLSCSAFEAVPDVLVEGVSDASSSRLATQDPQSLLVELLGEASRGAGAIIDHHPVGGGEPDEQPARW